MKSTAKAADLRQITILYVLLSIVSVVIPIALAGSEIPVISSTYGKQYVVFELFGFCQSIVLLGIGVMRVRNRRISSLRDAVVVCLPLLVGFFFLAIVVEFSQKSHDYLCYEYAGRAVAEGDNPYGGTRFRYLYPPLVAQVAALCHMLLSNLYSWTGLRPSEEATWYTVFYLYQCMQFFLIGLAYYLCVGLARRFGFGQAEAIVLVAVLFLFNTPLIRTIRFNQVNLYLLNVMLAAILLLRRHPWVSGLAVAAGAHIKLYPLLLGIPLFLGRWWKAVLAIFAGSILILLIETDFGRDFTLWEHYAQSWSKFPQSRFFRDNSIYSLTHNLLRLVLPPLKPAARWVSGLASLLVVAWFVARYRARERTFRAKDNLGDSARRDTPRLYGHLIDATSIVLLLSPMVWEHQYILALPLTIWAAAARGRKKPWLVGVAATLIFAVPTFDVFPLSYHRLAGLLLLLRAAAPGVLPPMRDDVETSYAKEKKGGGKPRGKS